MPTEPTLPTAERREHLLAVLADLVARNGQAPLLRVPVAPGKAAFPEPWRATRGGVSALLRRLAWYAELDDRAIVLDDERIGRRPTEHFQETRVELVEVRRRALAFEVSLLGDDDIGGTLSHEIGVAFAVLHRPEDPDPYRSADPSVIPVDVDRDTERGSIATVYLGLGVLAANAAYQQYSAGARNDAYAPLKYEILRAGYVPMSDLAYLLAVQAIVRDEARPPAGLSPPQRDEVAAWLAALAGRGDALRERLGIDAMAPPPERPPVVVFDDIDLDDDATKTGFRWHTRRGGLGMVVGAAIGAVFAFSAPAAALGLVLGGSVLGVVLGQRIQTVRCSACASVIAPASTACPKCGARLRGDITRLAERLEAEERLLARGDPADADANREADVEPSKPARPLPESRDGR